MSALKKPTEPGDQSEPEISDKPELDASCAADVPAPTSDGESGSIAAYLATSTDCAAEQPNVYASDKFDDEEQYIGLFYTGQNDKKTGTTLVFIAFIATALLLLAGIITFTKLSLNKSIPDPDVVGVETDNKQQTDIKLNDTENEIDNTTSRASLFSPGISIAQASVDASKPDQLQPGDSNSAAVKPIKALSEILSSRVVLISSENPKFIITETGKKIVPTDVIQGNLTVVDIFFDHVLVSSAGVTREIIY